MHTPVNRSVEEKHMQQISVPLSATIVLGGDNRKAPSIWLGIVTNVPEDTIVNYVRVPEAADTRGAILWTDKTSLSLISIYLSIYRS